jgi:hypothetical protein
MTASDSIFAQPTQKQLQQQQQQHLVASAHIDTLNPPTVQQPDSIVRLIY